MSTPLNATAASLLGFLHRNPMSGWDILQHVRESIGNFWNVSQSQVYGELRRLAEAGLVEVEATGARDRRTYRLTGAGREAFRDWAADEPGDDLVRSRLLLLVFFGSLLPPDHLRRVGRERRPSVQRELEEYRRLEPVLAEIDPFAGAVLRFGISYAQATEELLEFLESLGASEVSDPLTSDPSQ